VPLGRYEDRLRDLVLEMKRPDGQGLAAAIGQWFVVRRGEELGLLRPQLVAPIPHHWQRWLRQPASSPHTLARELARGLGVPVKRELLRCQRKLKRQHDLLPRERFRNVRGAFALGGSTAVNGLRILLVDDILTTGATCSEAARTLKRAGAAWVGAAIVARAADDLHY
ncbi:MAG: ComF family protein, partial [Planctomycetota bacterium]